MPDRLASGIFVATGRLWFVGWVRCWQAEEARAPQGGVPRDGQIKTQTGAT